MRKKIFTFDPIPVNRPSDISARIEMSSTVMPVIDLLAHNRPQLSRIS